MVNRYIIVGESVVLSEGAQSPFKGESFAVELNLPLQVYNKLMNLLSEADIFYRIEANPAAAHKTLLEVISLAAPYARSENDRRTLIDRAKSLLEVS